MTTYRLPALDWKVPIVDARTGVPSPYLQRFWQSVSLVAVDGANQATDISALESAVSTINGQITTINATLTGKAPLASPALTGNPTAPTQTAGNNSTRLATTAYVDTGLATRIAKATFTPWAAATGTATRTTFDTATVTLPELAERVKALIDDLKS